MRNAVRGHAPEIVDRFQVVVREEEPWLLQNEAQWTDHFKELIPKTCELALSPGRDVERIRAVLNLAARHGEDRLVRGFTESLLFRDYYILRQAIWAFMWDRWRDDPLVVAAITRIDVAISIATKAALRAFHRPTFERQGRWPECIDDLVSDWRELPEVD